MNISSPTESLFSKVDLNPGILCLHDERIRDLFDLKIFIHCDLDIALGRRILRDIAERGRDVTEVLSRYNRFVKPDFQKFVKPQMKLVDLIIPGGASNDIALNFVKENIHSRIRNESQSSIQAMESFQRIESSRKLSVNTVNKTSNKLKVKQNILVKANLENHIPLSKQLRRTAKAFFHQLTINPDANLLKNNMKYLSRLAREDVLMAMCSDFQMKTDEVQSLVTKVDIDGEFNIDLQSQNKRIFFIRKQSLLDREVACKMLAVIKKIDNFPVYVHVDFICREHVALICGNSPNTHLFSLYFLDSGSDFVTGLSPDVAQVLL